MKIIVSWVFLKNQVNKSQLVDVNKLNEVLDLLKKENETKTFLQGMKRKDEFQLEEKKYLLEKLIKN